MKSKANLVIQTAFLGDLILSIPVLQRIKFLFPDDKLIIVCKKGVGDFLLNEQIVDQVIEVEKSNQGSYAEARKYLKNFEINHLFCPHRSIRSLLFAAKIKANRKIGFSSFFGFFIFDDQIKFIDKNPEVIRQFKILESVDIETFNYLNDQDFSFLNSRELPSVPHFFSFKNQVEHYTITKRVAVFPGSVWATKKWTSNGFSDLCKLLVNDGYLVELMGAASERKLCNEIAEKVQGSIVRAGDLSITQTISEISKFDLVISNDSAPTHMAAFKNTPVVTIFGPTVLEQGFRPWSNNSIIVQNSDLKCRPCGRHGHHKCPLVHHDCMQTISAVQVYDAAKKVMKNLSR